MTSYKKLGIVLNLAALCLFLFSADSYGAGIIETYGIATSPSAPSALTPIMPFVPPLPTNSALMPIVPTFTPPTPTTSPAAVSTVLPTFTPPTPTTSPVFYPSELYPSTWFLPEEAGCWYCKPII